MKRPYLIFLVLFMPLVFVHAQSTITIVAGPNCAGDTVSCDSSGTVVCFAVELTPAITGGGVDVLLNYTLILTANCVVDTVQYNQSCVLDDNSMFVGAFCPVPGYVFNAQGDGNFAVSDGVPEIIHELCLTVGDPTDTVIVSPSNVSLFYETQGVEIPNLETDSFDLAAICPTLPVELLEFNAWKSRNTVELTWRTASEISNDRFEIERSRDGTAFTKIGSVRGHGTSFNHAYGFTDLQPYSGNNFYRLRQVDYDGKYKFSPIRIVQFGASEDGKELGLRVYPNPVKHLLNIELNQIPDEDYSIRLMDTNGSLVKEENFSGEMIMQMHDIESGIYILQLVNTQGELILTERIATFH